MQASADLSQTVQQTVDARREMSRPQARNHTLDCFRALCAVLILIAHAVSVVGGQIAFQHSAVMVDGFFAVSGFLLSERYDPALAGGASAVDLTFRRLIRIYPIYFAALSLGFAIALIEQHLQLTAQIVVQLVLGAAVLPWAASSSSPIFPLNIPTWSLMWEVWINIAFILAWPWLKGRVIAAILMISGGLVALAIYRHNGVNFGGLADGALEGGCRAVFAFFLGVALRRWRSRWRWRARVPGVLVLAAVLAALAFPTPTALSGTYEIILIGLGLPALVWLSADATMPARWAVLYVFFGDIYYGVYAWHLPAIHLMGHVMKAMALHASLGCGIALAIAVASWSFLFNETLDMWTRRTASRIWGAWRSRIPRSVLAHS